MLLPWFNWTYLKVHWRFFLDIVQFLCILSCIELNFFFRKNNFFFFGSVLCLFVLFLMLFETFSHFNSMPTKLRHARCRECVCSVTHNSTEHTTIRMYVIIFNKFEYFMKVVFSYSTNLMSSSRWCCSTRNSTCTTKNCSYFQHILFIVCVCVCHTASVNKTDSLVSINSNLCLFKWFCQIAMSLLK